MIKLLKLIIANIISPIPEITKKDILCSSEYQYLAKEAKRIENDNQEIKKIIKEHLKEAYERNQGSDAEKLQNLLKGKNALIQTERVKARTSRLETEKTQKTIQTLRDETVPKEILQEIMQQINTPIITLDTNFLVVGYSEGTKKYSQLNVSRDTSYQRLFANKEDFEIFESAIRKLKPGERKNIFTIMGKKENPMNFISTIYPIYSGARLVGYGVSIKPETILHGLGRKLSTKKSSGLEIRIQKDILSEPEKA